MIAEIDGEVPEDRIRSFIDILIVNGEKIKRYGCPIGTLTSELAKLNHTAQGDANQLCTLFRTWLRRQIVALGRKADADLLAMHLLARSQGVATLSNAFQDEEFVNQEVEQMYGWLRSCSAALSLNGPIELAHKALAQENQRKPIGVQPDSGNCAPKRGLGMCI